METEELEASEVWTDREADEPDVERITIADILSAENLMDLIDEQTLAQIGSRVVTEFEIDQTSRKDWLDAYRRWLDLAMQVKSAKTFPWPNAANVKLPLLSTAAIQFQARAYPAIVDGTNVVKARVLGPDPDGQKRVRADNVASHMSWQLLQGMPGWEEETDQMLLMLPIVGCVFRKSYHDQTMRQNVSEMVSAEDFVVNYWTKSLEATPRYTHILRYYPHEIRERVLAGIWADPGHLSPSNDSKASQNDPEATIDFLEQFRMIDLDDDGYPEPYVVTVTREGGKVVRIMPCFSPENVTLAQGPNGPEVLRIERDRYFTKYGFIPAVDGSFYDIGFGKLLDDLSATIDTTINQMLDAGTLQNAQGGFIGAGVNMRSGSMKFRIGEWKRVDVSGGTLRENIVPLNLQGPSPVLFNLLGLMIDFAKGVTSVQDIMTGDAGSNQAVGTTLARIEQGMKMFTAIYKRIHRSFGQELKILFRLNRQFLDGEEWFALTDTPAQVGQRDYQEQDLDVVPTSDPNSVADMVKIARVDALLERFNGDPLINQGELRKMALSAYGVPGPDAERLLTVPEPGPDPKLLLETTKQANLREKTEAEIRTKDAQAAEALMNTATKALAIGLVSDAAALAGSAVKLGGEASEEDENEPVGEPGGVPEMEGPSDDAGMVSVPGGLPGGAEGAMGAGGIALPGGAAAGGPDGAALPTDL